MSDTSDAKEQEIRGEISENSELRKQLKAQRLRADTAEAEIAKLRERHDTVKCQRNDATKGLAAAEQRIAKMAKVLTDIRQSCELSHLRDALLGAALNQKSEGESQSDYLQSCAAAERALAIKPPCQQPQAHPARCGCED